MYPVGVHVIREPGRTTDSGHKDDLFLRHTQVGHEGLHCGEDRVVTAAGAPTHLLIGLKICPRVVGGDGVRHDATISRILFSISDTRKGNPLTLLKPMAGTRNSARISFRN